MSTSGVTSRDHTKVCVTLRDGTQMEKYVFIRINSFAVKLFWRHHKTFWEWVNGYKENKPFGDISLQNVTIDHLGIYFRNKVFYEDGKRYVRNPLKE